MTPRELAEGAKQILESPVMRKVFSDIRDSLVVQLESTAMDDIQTHHEVAQMLQLHRRYQTMLSRYVSDNALDQHKRKQDSFIEKMKERLA